MINSRRTARTNPQRIRGLTKASQNRNRVIYGRHEQCQWQRSWANLLHFTPISLSPAFPMELIYLHICVLRGFGKSVSTLQTCFDLPSTISDNFFSSFRCTFFVQIQLRFCSASSQMSDGRALKNFRDHM